jgi:asparaginyl-tRNA synthetase
MESLTGRRTDTRLGQIIRIRACVLNFLRNWLNTNNYLEIQAPVIVSRPIDRHLSFELSYFDKPAFISHNSQLYLETAAFYFGNVWTLNPSFRAEREESNRHLAEFQLLQVEKVRIKDLTDVLRIQEKMLYELIKNMLAEMRDLFNPLEIDLGYMQEINAPFDKMTYEQAISILKSDGFKVEVNGTKRNIEWGDDIGAQAEWKLTHHRIQPLFITHYPMKLRPFYIKHYSPTEDVSVSADLLAPRGYGELTSGGIREDDVLKVRNELQKRYNDKNLFDFYCDLKIAKWKPHGGFGLGIERLLRWLTDTPNIRNVTLFPRTSTITEP